MSVRIGACLALLVLFLSVPAVAGEVTIGTPDGGNGFPFNQPAPFGGWPGTRYQQVYDSSSFASPVSITGITFFHYLGSTLKTADYEIRLSTSANPVDGLSSTFADNVGADDQLFVQVGLSGPAPAELVFTGTPFDYDPANGDLLLDIAITNAGTGGTLYKAMNGGAGGLFSRMHDFGPGGFTGYGLVTKFTYRDVGGAVPVPPGAALGLVLLGGLALVRRMRRS